MKKTAIYARYSSHAQDGGTSIEVQLDACRRDLEPKTFREYPDRHIGFFLLWQRCSEQNRHSFFGEGLLRDPWPRCGRPLKEAGYP